MTGADLQQAINQTGGKIILPPGIIELTTPLALAPNVWIEGDGLKTTLKAAEGFNYPALIDTGSSQGGVVRLSNLIVDANQQNTIGIFLQSPSPGSMVSGVTIKSTIRSGIIVGSVVARAQGVILAHNTFQSCGSLSSTADFMAIGVVNAIDVQIIGNQIIDSPIAIDCEMHPGVDDALMNIQITSNLIRTSQSYPTCWGISVLGQPGRPARWISVTNNHLLGPNPNWLYTEHVEAFVQGGNTVFV